MGSYSSQFYSEFNSLYLLNNHINLLYVLDYAFCNIDFYKLHRTDNLHHNFGR